LFVLKFRYNKTVVKIVNGKLLNITNVFVFSRKPVQKGPLFMPYKFLIKVLDNYYIYLTTGNE
jgi:hypothetical protein